MISFRAKILRWVNPMSSFSKGIEANFTQAGKDKGPVPVKGNWMVIPFSKRW